MTPDMQNQAMAQAMGPSGPPMGAAPGPQTPGPAFPPELLAIAAELGLDINDPQQLMILIQMLAGGGGGPMGPMAGAPPSGSPPQGGPPMPPPGM